jgi:hypothetical protein
MEFAVGMHTAYLTWKKPIQQKKLETNSPTPDVLMLQLYILYSFNETIV